MTAAVATAAVATASVATASVATAAVVAAAEVAMAVVAVAVACTEGLFVVCVSWHGRAYILRASSLLSLRMILRAHR